MLRAIGAGLRSCEPSKPRNYDAFPARCGLAGVAAGEIHKRIAQVAQPVSMLLAS
jgi:hypothetical protein